MIRVSSIRFHSITLPVPRYLRLALLVTLVLGGWMIWLNPRDADSALGSLLLLQMCAASNGYASAATRGWFDPLLVSGRDRRGTAYANLAATALPGIAAWAALAFFQALLVQPAWPSSLSPHRLAALALVTTGAWAAGLRLPRTAAAMLWVVVLVALGSSRRWLPDLASLQAPPAGPMQLGMDVAACIVCPFILLGDSPAVRDPLVLTGIAIAAGAFAAGGAAWLARRDWPLVVAS